MMKFPLFIFLAAVLAALPVCAQQPPEDQAQKALQPSQFPSNEPSKQVAEFFRILSEGRVDAAYDQLLQGTKIAEMPKDVAVLKAKTREAIKVFGDINGYESVDVKPVGSHLIRITSLSIAKNLPIRWRFYFYMPLDKWKLIDIRIDDRLPDLFEEPAPAAIGSAK